MLTKPQKDQISKSFAKLAESLNKEQLSKLYFGLDDLMQYDKEALPVAYHVVGAVKAYRKGE